MGFSELLHRFIDDGWTWQLSWGHPDDGNGTPRYRFAASKGDRHVATDDDNMWAVVSLARAEAFGDDGGE